MPVRNESAFPLLAVRRPEGRRPHPLFDPKYYLEQNPDVARSGHNPLLHFLRFGGLEGRSPHPDFNSAFYLAANPDVAQAHANPLMHFIMHGAAEGRLPHPEFDSAFYLAANPDVTAAQLLPVLHFAEHGAAEGRLFRRETQLNRPLDWFLPSSVQPRRPPDGEIDVVIPVFKGLVETEACLAAVLQPRRRALSGGRRQRL